MTVFDRIYRGNLWHGSESRSGPGSGSAATERVANEIVGLVAELGVTSVLDLGCGDGYWMPELPGYVGVDPSAEAIRRAKRNHPDREFSTILPPRGFDIAIVRDVIQHLRLVDGGNLLVCARMTDIRWLLASTFTDGSNIDIVTGDAYRPDMSDAPFDLGRPDVLIFDGWGYDDPDAVRDPGKHLGLWKL